VESELSEMTAAMDQEDSTETEIKKELIEEKNKLDTHENTAKDNLAKTKHWKKEVFIYYTQPVCLDFVPINCLLLWLISFTAVLSDSAVFNYNVVVYLCYLYYSVTSLSRHSLSTAIFWREASLAR